METSKISGAGSGIHLHMALEYRPHILLRIGHLKAAMCVYGTGVGKVGSPDDTYMGFLVERHIDAESARLFYGGPLGTRAKGTAAVISLARKT